MQRGDRLLGLIQQLYAAPGSADGWCVFLENLRATVQGSAAQLISHDLQSHRGDMLATAGADVEGTHLYQRYWSAFDPWAYSPKYAELRQSSVTVELIEHAQLKRTAFYADFGRHYDLVRIMGGVIEGSPAATSVLSVARSERGQPFSERDAAIFSTLVPHLQRALQLHRRLLGAQAAVENLTSILERSSRALLLLDAGGRVTFMTSAASRLLAMRDGMSVERHELRASNVSDRAWLRAAISAAVNTSSGVGFGPGGMRAIGRPSGRRPYFVLVCPVTHGRTSFPGVETAAAIVFVKDPEHVAIPKHETLQTLFDLTPAEARLTRLLVQGASLMEAGAQLGIRRESARSRMKAVFEKTNTHRQAELVLLVLNALPRM